MSPALALPGGLELAQPWALPAALAGAAVVALLGTLLGTLLGARAARRGASGRPALLLVPGVLLPEGRSTVPATARQRLRHAPARLGALGLALLALALAGPGERRAAPPRARGLDLLLCLDRSSSMTTQDLAPGRTRLAVAQDEAQRFLDGRPHDRVGLLTFARFPDLLCPPTLDHAALGALLAGLAPVREDSGEDATGIGTAVARGAQALRASPARGRVLLLLTDGEENVAGPDAPDEITPEEAAGLCRAWGVRVHAVLAGVGREGAGDAPLARLVAASGGRLFRARDAEGLRAVYAQVDALETTVFDAGRTERVPRALPFVLAGLALLLLGRLLASGPLRVSP